MEHQIGDLLMTKNGELGQIEEIDLAWSGVKYNIYWFKRGYKIWYGEEDVTRCKHILEGVNELARRYG